MQSVRTTIGGLGNLMFKQAYLYARMRDGVIPDIYLQDEKYFKEYAEEIKQMFGEGIGYDERVSLHIRRGDYITKNTTPIITTPDFYVNLANTDYYQKAVEMFPRDKFLVFCCDRQDSNQDKSDREWCAEFLDTFIKGRWEFWEPQSETDDLNAMASCKNNILANSSFSHWCGILNPNPSKKVICPPEDKYYSDGVIRCNFPDYFMRLDFDLKGIKLKI